MNKSIPPKEPLPRLFSDQEWMKRFDNHEIMLREIGQQLHSHINYCFKLEELVKNLNKMIINQQAQIRALEIYNKQNIELIEKIGENMMMKDE